MKRIFPLILTALLLTACAGKNTTESSAQIMQTSTVSEPTGNYLPNSLAEQQTGGAVRAYSGSYTEMYSVDAGLAVLDTEGVLTVLDTQDGVTLGTYNGISDILAVDGNSVFYYDSMVYALCLDDGTSNTWTLPKDLLGDFAVGTETQEIYYCVSGEIRALDMKTGLSRLLKEHSFEQQSILGAYFGGRVIAWESEGGVAYLSTADGTTLFREQGIHGLETCGDSYMALRVDGIVEQVIVGQLEGKAQQLYLEKENLWAALELNGVVALDENGGLTASFYDITSGMKTAAVTIPDEQSVLAVTAMERYVWLLTENTLYRWEISMSAVEDSTVYSGPVFTAENPDTDGLAQCQSRVSQMNSTYGVRIRIWEDAVSEPDQYTLIPEYQVQAINQMLDQLEPILMQFPSNFLRKTVEAGWVRICLVRRIDDGEDYVRYWADGDCYIAIALGADIQEAFLTGLGGAVDSHILGNSRDLEYWNDLNPDGFEYSYDLNTALDANSAYIGQYFADMRSMTYPTEDRARIFYFGMTEGNEALFQAPEMQQKLKKLCEGIREAYGLQRKSEEYPWEQYLTESLAYQD